MKIAVLMGGTSAERGVSLASGEGIAKALEEAGHEAVKIDIAPMGGWLPLTALNALWPLNVDLAFIALHGGCGEDGTIQALLDLMGVPYTGSGVLACALSMDKAMAKTIFKQKGIRTPPWFKMDIDGNTDLRTVAEKIDGSVGFPVVVKPNNQGSTIGVSIVEGSEGLASAIEKAKGYTDELLFEGYIAGRELTVAILEDEPLPVLEIHPEHGIYDYECKYTKGKSRYTVPAEIPPEVASETQQMALAAFKAIKCEGLVRVDFRLSRDNLPCCLEVNAVPGMTETSLVPKAAKAAGIGFPQLVDKIAKLALKRQAHKCKSLAMC